MSNRKISRRDALKVMGGGALGLAVASAGIGNASAAGKGGASSSIESDVKVARRAYKGEADKVSLLGFGAMRFPTIEGNMIEEVSSEKMLDYAYEHGVNYFDTAYNYHRGASEGFLGGVLKKYPRESFYLADKMPTWEIKSLERAKEIFQTQLERCGVEYFDYYLLHSVSKEEDFQRAYKEMGVLEYLKSEKAAGRIRNLGFSFHGNNELFDKLLDEYDWDFVQIQLNYYDWDQDDAKYLYNRLAERGIPCTVMEPIRGGMLAKLNPDAEAVLKGVHPDKSVASWALRYVASLPGVLTVLSGMTAMEHVVDNVETLSTSFKPLDDDERAALAKALDIFLKTKPIRCTSCRYCMPCKQGVDIPRVFKAYNSCVNESNIPERGSQSPEEFERRKKIFLERYEAIPAEERADACIHCRKCEKMCPQRLPISAEMKRLADFVASL